MDKSVFYGNRVAVYADVCAREVIRALFQLGAPKDALLTNSDTVDAAESRDYLHKIRNVVKTDEADPETKVKLLAELRRQYSTQHLDDRDEVCLNIYFAVRSLQKIRSKMRGDDAGELVAATFDVAVTLMSLGRFEAAVDLVTSSFPSGSSESLQLRELVDLCWLLHPNLAVPASVVESVKPGARGASESTSMTKSLVLGAEVCNMTRQLRSCKLADFASFVDVSALSLSDTSATSPAVFCSILLVNALKLLRERRRWCASRRSQLAALAKRSANTDTIKALDSLKEKATSVATALRRGEEEAHILDELIKLFLCTNVKTASGFATAESWVFRYAIVFYGLFGHDPRSPSPASDEHRMVWVRSLEEEAVFPLARSVLRGTDTTNSLQVSAAALLLRYFDTFHSAAPPLRRHIYITTRVCLPQETDENNAADSMVTPTDDAVVSTIVKALTERLST